jgi:hypothetical protein
MDRHGNLIPTTIVLTMAQIGTLLTEGTIEAGGAKLILANEPNHYATGAEIKEFYTRGWNNDYYYEPDNGSIPIENADGDWILEADSMYDLRQLGTLEWQGGPVHPNNLLTVEFEDAFLAWKKNREFEIDINGRKYMRRSPQSYHDIVGTWGNAPAIVSVIYHKAPGPKTEGSLIPGQSIPVQNGTRFSVADTSNA